MGASLSVCIQTRKPGSPCFPTGMGNPATQATRAPRVACWIIWIRVGSGQNTGFIRAMALTLMLTPQRRAVTSSSVCAYLWRAPLTQMETTVPTGRRPAARRGDMAHSSCSARPTGVTVWKKPRRSPRCRKIRAGASKSTRSCAATNAYAKVS